MAHRYCIANRATGPAQLISPTHQAVMRVKQEENAKGDKET